jgi:hypothetical protein
MQKADSTDGKTASERITDQIAELGDWRGDMLAQFRQLILAAAPALTEDWKWGTAVWTYKGMVCSIAPFKDHVKLHFFKGASFMDPNGLFNGGLDAKATRSIDFSKGDNIDMAALKDLIRAAVAYNESTGKK